MFISEMTLMHLKERKMQELYFSYHTMSASKFTAIYFAAIYMY